MATTTEEDTQHQSSENSTQPEHVNESHEPAHQSRQEEKEQLADFQRRQSRPLSPENITKAPQKKGLGYSSHNLKVSDFELLRTIGTGTFARVWLSRFAGSDTEEQKKYQDKVFALKILRKVDVIKLKQVEHVRNERNTLAEIAGHPFITTMITSFSDDQCLYMLLDYCPGGEIFSFLRRARRFNEYTSKFYAAEIVMILDFLHNKIGVAYRDLKPENILLDADGHLKLVDFGFAKKVWDQETYTLCGTPEYLAPEVIKNSGHGTAVDWWALGILIYEFLVGQPPFWDQNPLRIYEQIVAGHLRFPPNMSGNARNIIWYLCRTNPSERLGNISGGVDRIKSHPFFDDIDWEALYYKKMKGPILPRVDHPADAGNFDEYPDPTEKELEARYDKEMKSMYEGFFRDF